MGRCNVDTIVTDGIVEIHLNGSADVAAARELQEALLQALPPEGDIAVRLEGIQRLDGAGLQLLLAVKAWAARSGRRLFLRGPSDVALRALQTSGAMSLLDSEAPPEDTSTRSTT